MLCGKPSSVSSGVFWILRVLSRMSQCLEQRAEGLGLPLGTDPMCHYISPLLGVGGR